ncbi:MAG: AMP-binding protein [Eggerthellaceae bacterium]|nr:AMP-binding protein [Eggerthellaceae bacterium]
MLWDLQSFGSKTALVQDGDEYTYEQLAGLSAQVAALLPARSLVFALCTNTLGSIAGYLGFLNGGIVPLLLDSAINKDLLSALNDVYEPGYYWVPEGMEAEFSQFKRVAAIAGYVLLATESPAQHALHPDLAVLVSTSGSTGTPKLIRLSYANIASNTNSICEYLKITDAERAITSLPMNYVYGLSVLQTHISRGATLVLTDLNCYAGQFWKLFAQQECTSFAGVPFMYEMLEKLRFTKQNRYPSLKTMTQAGGRLSPELQDKFAAFARDNGIDFVVMYGASEATARMSYLPPQCALEKRGSIGIPIPGGRFEIVGADGQPVPAGESGELAYYGENVSLGYATCAEDLARDDDNNGRLLTGDLAREDEDGFYYVVGRKKRFVKILGKRTSLDEVENILKQHFDVIDLACGGKDDLLAVFLAADVDPAAVSRFVFETLGINEKMIRVVEVGEIPKNTSGKIQYAQLNELLEEGEGR